jgi:lipopolysaccharide export system protein LptC
VGRGASRVGVAIGGNLTLISTFEHAPTAALLVRRGDNDQYAPTAARLIGRGDNDRLFRAAARHSRFVRFLRRTIPAGIAMIAAVIVVAAFFNPYHLIAAFPIDPGKLSLSGTKIVMDLPHLTGFTSDARPYQLTARAAAQDITKPEILELKDIDAHVEMKDGQQIVIKSINGVYDTKAELLKLSDHIVLTTSSGYEGRLSEATVNINTGHVVSDHPVEVKLTNGLLNANQLEILENGDLVRFTEGVEMMINADRSGAATQTAETLPHGERSGR